MVYRVLIVDDELPTQRFVQNIVEKYTSGYRIAGICSSGEQALALLSCQPIDLLITDISMHGMNGVELAKQARAALPGIHILIISGYGEFEYAQGAIQAGVDDYIVKPVNLNKIVAVLESIREKLDAERQEQIGVLLPAVACGQPFAKEKASGLFGSQGFRFALIRWGNLDMTMPRALSATSLILPADEVFFVLRGRDDDERVLVCPDDSPEVFLTNLSVYATQPGRLSAWTAIYSAAAQPIERLHSFLEGALDMLYHRVVISKHQILQLTGGVANEEKMRLPAADLKQLSYFMTTGKTHMIKNYFVSLAVRWEHAQMPQRQAWHMCRQIIHQIAALNQPIYNRMEDILQKFNEMIQCTNSYGDLMNSLYSLLFENGSVRDKKLSVRELYAYAVQYVTENYAQPLSMQSVCDEIGISQTYLSRLFRKYSDTTFNAFLTRCRMEAAKTLLREKPNLLLRDVAACVGYEDSSYFTKVFHQYTGLTPSQFASGEG